MPAGGRRSSSSSPRAECLELAGSAGARLELAHCSTPRAVDLGHGRASRARVTVETCPHYLFLTEADLERSGPFAKINPALRSPEAVAGLWERLVRGEIDVIGSDHSPFLVEEKAPVRRRHVGALPGAPGLESLLPLMLTAVAEGRLTWSRLAEVTSGNAARIFGLGGEGRTAGRRGRGRRPRGPGRGRGQSTPVAGSRGPAERRRSGTAAP